MTCIKKVGDIWIYLDEVKVPDTTPIAIVFVIFALVEMVAIVGLLLFGMSQPLSTFLQVFGIVAILPFSIPAVFVFKKDGYRVWIVSEDIYIEKTSESEDAIKIKDVVSQLAAIVEKRNKLVDMVKEK